MRPSCIAIQLPFCCRHDSDSPGLLERFEERAEEIASEQGQFMMERVGEREGRREGG